MQKSAGEKIQESRLKRVALTKHRQWPGLQPYSNSRVQYILRV